MEFEWDPKKSAANARKHTVTFQEASTVINLAQKSIGITSRSSRRAKKLHAG